MVWEAGTHWEIAAWCLARSDGQSDFNPRTGSCWDGSLGHTFKMSHKDLLFLYIPQAEMFTLCERVMKLPFDDIKKSTLESQ